MLLGKVQHELIHVLGYNHMHNHVDRDEFVTINLENVGKSYLRNFVKVNPAYSSNFGTPYDFQSVMHYDRNAFSKNGEDTIVPRDRKYEDVIGNVERMSRGDVQRINTMYQCRNRARRI